MMLQEFAALKPGDKIANPMNNSSAEGTVTRLGTGGLYVVWGKRFDRETEFFYSVQSTAWMHWDKTAEHA